MYYMSNYCSQAKSSQPAPPAHDVTPYYSLQSFTSPLRTVEDPRLYHSALSTTPLPSPIHRRNERKLVSRTTSTLPMPNVTVPKHRDKIAQTTGSLHPLQPIKEGIDFSGQTTASLVGEASVDEQTVTVGVEVATQADIAIASTPLTAEFGAQTTSSIDLQIKKPDSIPPSKLEKRKASVMSAKAGPDDAPNTTAEFGLQTEVESSSLDESSVDSKAKLEDDILDYDVEVDPALVGRTKKLTKPRSDIVRIPSAIGSSYIFLREKKITQVEVEESLVGSASLESLASRFKSHRIAPQSDKDKILTEISSPAHERNYGRKDESILQYGLVPLPPESPQPPPTPLPPVARYQPGSSTSLSSESNIGGKLPENLDLENGFLYMIIPPDGGYGWLVVFISFLCQVIVDGIIFSIGILLPYMATDLGETQTKIVLVASIQVGCYFLAGPVASAFINKYGFRPVALGGAICSITVILIATWSPNLPMLIIFYSILGGPSLSLIWVSSQLIIGYYFERYRPIANGVSCAGAGAGICIFSFMNAELCPLYGWRNTSRIHTFLLFCVLLMAITFIEVTPTRIATVEKEVDSSSSEESIVPFSQVRYSEFYASRYTLHKSIDRGFEQMLEVYEPVKATTLQRICPCCFRKKELEDTISSDSEASHANEIEVSKSTVGTQQHYVIRLDPIEREDLFFTGPAVYSEENISTRRTAGHKVILSQEKAKSINYSLSMARVHRQQKPKRYKISELRHRHKNPYLAYIHPRNWMPAKLYNAFSKLFDVNMLKIMEFRVLLLSAFLFPMGFNIPFVYSKMRAELDEENKTLISPAIGLSNFVFRILSGFAANRFRSQTTYMCGGGIVFGGLATFISAFYGEDVVWFQYTYAVCYGVAPAFFSTLRAIIYVRTLGLDKLTNAFGLTGLAMGLGVFMGTTTAAVLNGWTNHYNAAFAFSGVCLVLAGVLKLILPTLIAYKIKREQDVPAPKKGKRKP